jgi:hypothetical protein
MVKINFTEIAPGIILYSDIMEDPNVFVKELEESVELKSIYWSPAYQGSAGNPSLPSIDKKIRNCKTITIPPYDSMDDSTKNGALFEIHKYLNNTLNPPFNSYCSYFNCFPWGKNEGWQLLKYESQNFFVNHYDDSKNFQRTISMSYFLNDNYIGGEIEFARFNLKIKPKANQALFFPSNYVYNHQVHDVISGIRYTIVGWWE